MVDVGSAQASTIYVLHYHLSFLFVKLSTVTVWHSQPARNPGEGVLQNLKKDRLKNLYRLKIAPEVSFKLLLKKRR